jgi:hypothetical protein
VIAAGAVVGLAIAGCVIALHLVRRCRSRRSDIADQLDAGANGAHGLPRTVEA